MRLMIFLILVLSLSSAVTAGEYNLEKVRKLSDENNCTPLWHNPKVGPLIKFWYADISSITGRSDEFVFMCQLQSDPRVFRIVIATSPERRIWKGCTSIIDIDNVVPFPSGLAVRSADDPDYFHLNLSEWSDDKGTHGPENVMAKEPIIDTSDKVAGDLFYCYEGRWFRLFVD